MDERNGLGRVCLLCGVIVTSDEADKIEIDMEYENKTCAACFRTFKEAREQEL